MPVCLVDWLKWGEIRQEDGGRLATVNLHTAVDGFLAQPCNVAQAEPCGSVIVGGFLG